MSGAKRSIWASDFETTTKVEDCRVWGWGLANVDKAIDTTDVEIGTDLDSYIERVSRSNSIVYFHNLKFDGHFILDWLFRHHFVWAPSRLVKGEFSTLISNMGMFYTITVAWKNGKKTEFRDSMKKLPYSVSVVAEAFGLPEAKGEIDYYTERPVGHKVTAEEAEYIALDVLIVAKALKVQFDEGMTRLTVGSDSLAEFRKLTGSKVFLRNFPILSDEMDAEIRQSYRGGFTYADKRFKGKITRSGRTYDVNSLYPSVMRHKLLPYGEPVWREGYPSPTAEYPLFIATITFTAKLKKNHIPCIQVKNNSRFTGTEYLTAIKEPLTLTVTSVDLALWQDHYDLEVIAYNGAWFFHAAYGMFNEYIDKWMEVKINSTGGMKALAKLHLNSLYG